MTVTIRHGDIFESKAKFLVNPVNCEGISGKGLALTFKNRFPDGQKEYVQVCKKNDLKMGTVFCYWPTINQCIVYFPTKQKPSSLSNIRDIYEGLVSLRQIVHNNYMDWNSVALPALGCGLGRLDFARLEAAVRYTFERFPKLEVDLYKPHE